MKELTDMTIPELKELHREIDRLIWSASSYMKFRRKEDVETNTKGCLRGKLK